MAQTIRRFIPYVYAGLGASGGAAIYYFGVRQKEKKEAFASCTTNYTAPTCTKWDWNWDHRNPSSLVKPSEGVEDDNRFNEEVEQKKSKAFRHLLLIRHGQYNTKAELDKDQVLTELGREQAVLTGERLKELAFPYTAIVRSTMTRAQETSKLIEASIPGVPVKDCSLLEEGAPISPEPPYADWRPDPHEFFQDGPRIEAAFRKYVHRAEPSQEKDSYEVIVCHGNVIKYFVCRALQFPAEGWGRLHLRHGSITRITLMPDGQVALISLGDVEHMPQSKISAI